MDKQLQNIIKDANNATFFISTPRTGTFTPAPCKKFVDTFNRTENTKMESERVSKRGETVQMWVRSYGNNTYMIETHETNLV